MLRKKYQICLRAISVADLLESSHYNALEVADFDGSRLLNVQNFANRRIGKNLHGIENLDRRMIRDE